MDAFLDYMDYDTDPTVEFDTVNTYTDKETPSNGGLSITEAPPTSETTTDLLVSDVTESSSVVNAPPRMVSHSVVAGRSTMSNETVYEGIHPWTSTTEDQTSEAPTTCSKLIT